MRNLWLGLALLPYLAAAGIDAWMHERGRLVPRLEQWLHGGLALSMSAFLLAVFTQRTAGALVALGIFAALLAWDELGFHRSIARSEKRVHIVSWIALAGFVAAWWALDAA
jgi:hypothetical protein